MRARVLFPHGRVHPSNGPLCVLLCCSHMVVFIFPVARMVVFIFQVAQYACYGAVPARSCSFFKWPVMRATVLFPHGRVRF